ncbi:MAG: hypothetical protein WDO14_02595 [Bacteroidota bacterium]
MKKPLLILSVAAAFVIAGCDNENTTNPEPLGTVTIKGAIVSDLDEDDDPDDLQQLEKIPADVSVYFVDASTGALLQTVKTTADGYTADIQIGGPRDILIVVGDFNTQINVDIDGDDKFEKVNAVYNRRQFGEVDGAVKGATYIENLEIDQPEILDF